MVVSSADIACAAPRPKMTLTSCILRTPTVSEVAGILRWMSACSPVNSVISFPVLKPSAQFSQELCWLSRWPYQVSQLFPYTYPHIPLGTADAYLHTHARTPSNTACAYLRVLPTRSFLSFQVLKFGYGATSAPNLGLLACFDTRRTPGKPLRVAA